MLGVQSRGARGRGGEVSGREGGGKCGELAAKPNTSLEIQVVHRGSASVGGSMTVPAVEMMSMGSKNGSGVVGVGSSGASVTEGRAMLG